MLDMNFAVPHPKVLRKTSKPFESDASKPGPLHEPAMLYGEFHKGEDGQLKLDGKKIAYGFGKNLGDEDLDGHEEPPTLGR